MEKLVILNSQFVELEELLLSQIATSVLFLIPKEVITQLSRIRLSLQARGDIEGT